MRTRCLDAGATVQRASGERYGVKCCYVAFDRRMKSTIIICSTETAN